MIQYIKIIIGVLALTLPLCVASAQNEKNKKTMFVSLGLKTHSFDYENESIGRLYGKSVGMNSFSFGNKIHNTLSWQVGVAYGKTKDVRGLQGQINDESSCNGFTTHSYTEGNTTIEEFSAGIIYVQQSKANKIAAPRYGIAYRELTYNYERDYRYNGSDECEKISLFNSYNENHNINLKGVELSIGVELGSGGLCGGGGVFDILGASCEENKNLKFNIAYSETLFLDKKSDNGEVNTNGIENLSNFNIGFLYYF